VLDHGRESWRVERVALAKGDGPPGRVAVAAGDEPLGIGGETPVVEKDVDVVRRRLQGGDGALQDKVGSVGALDGLVERVGPGRDLDEERVEVGRDDGAAKERRILSPKPESVAPRADDANPRHREDFTALLNAAVRKPQSKD